MFVISIISIYNYRNKRCHRSYSVLSRCHQKESDESNDDVLFLYSLIFGLLLLLRQDDCLHRQWQGRLLLLLSLALPRLYARTIARSNHRSIGKSKGVSLLLLVLQEVTHLQKQIRYPPFVLTTFFDSFVVNNEEVGVLFVLLSSAASASINAANERRRQTTLGMTPVVAAASTISRNLFVVAKIATTEATNDCHMEKKLTQIQQRTSQLGAFASFFLCFDRGRSTDNPHIPKSDGNNFGDRSCYFCFGQTLS